MIPKLKRGVSAVRARNSTLPTRWPCPGGTTTGRRPSSANGAHRLERLRLVEEHLAAPGHAVLEGPQVVDHLVELDAARLRAPAQAHVHVDALAEVHDLLGDV